MTSTTARQPKGIPVGGPFAATEHGEPERNLPSAAPRLSHAAVLDAVEASNGPGAVSAVDRQIDSTTTPGGYQLYLQRCDALYNPESPYRVDRSMYGPSPEQCDSLAALGYDNVNQFAPDRLKTLRGVDSIIAGDIEPGRLELLGRLSRHEYQWSAWEREAYLTAPLDDLDAVTADPHQLPKDKYLDTVALLGPEKAARAKRGLELGLLDRGLLEADGHPLETIVDLRNALPHSKRGVNHIVGLAAKGITGNHLRTYGAKACEQYTAKELDSAAVAPKTIRSFLASGIRTDLDGMKTLHDAGYTNGNDLKAASQAMGTSDVGTLAAARKHSTGEQLATFSGAMRASVTLKDAKAVSFLVKNGITEPAQLRPYTAAAHARANQFVDRDQSILAIHADIIKAGISPERLGQMQRAGIPVDEAPAYKDSSDLWVDGQKYRDADDADQARKLEGRWIRAVTPWAFTADNYTDGAAR